MSPAPRVLVIGAGITGLACAFELAEAGRDVRVVEAAPRPGGVVRTRQEDGFLFEDGPNTVLASARELRELCGRLDLAQRLVVSKPETSVRYLFFRGRLVALPLGPRELLRTPLLSLGAKLRLASEPLRRFRPPAEEPSLAAFLEERIGRQATQRLAGAFVRGVYAAELDQLGAASALPRVYSAACEHGGLVRGLRAGRASSSAPPAPGPATARGALLSLPHGLGELVEALARRLGERLSLGRTIEHLEPAGNGWRAWSDGQAEKAEEVVLALPARPAAALLEGLVPAAELEPLAAVESADVTVVHVGLVPEPGAAPLLPPGFGFLVPPEEAGPAAPRVLGMLFPSNLFAGRAPEGAASVTAIYRTADRQGMEHEALVAGAVEDLARALGRPPAARVAAAASLRWSEAIPRYGVGHAQRMARVLEAAQRQRGLTLAGSWHAGISLDDRIAAGRRAAAASSERRTA